MPKTPREWHYYGTCATCGKMCFDTRAAAKTYARSRSFRGISEYRCGEFWHFGHLPGPVRRGDQTRDDIFRLKG